MGNSFILKGNLCQTIKKTNYEIRVRKKGVIKEK